MRATVPHDKAAPWSGRNLLLRIRMMSSADDSHGDKDFFRPPYRTREGSAISLTPPPDWEGRVSIPGALCLLKDILRYVLSTKVKREMVKERIKVLPVVWASRWGV